MHRIVITGGSGFIGTHAVELMLKKNIEVLNIDIQKPKVSSHSSFWRQCDIKKFSYLSKIFSKFNPTHVLHLAAKANLKGKTITDFPNNTVGTKNIVDCVKQTTSIKRFIHVSTQYVVQPGIMPENDDFFMPYTAYGESKMEGEKIVRRADLTDVCWTIVRPTNIWGPWHPAFPKELWKYLGKRYYLHPGFKPIKKYYGYVENIVYQIDGLLNTPDDKVNGQVFYVTDPPIDSTDWMNAFSVALSGKPVRRIPKLIWRMMAMVGDLSKKFGFPAPISSDRYFRLTVQENIPFEKILDLTGKPPYSLEDGINRSLEWIRANAPNLITK